MYISVWSTRPSDSLSHNAVGVQAGGPRSYLPPAQTVTAEQLESLVAGIDIHLQFSFQTGNCTGERRVDRNGVLLADINHELIVFADLVDSLCGR